jgi:aminopeptidase N
MNSPPPAVTRLADYHPPPFLVDTVQLEVDLHESHADVRSRLAVRRNPRARYTPDLRLDGHELPLRAARLDGEGIPRARLDLTPDALVVRDVPDAFQLQLETRIRPQENTALEGLYKSSGNFCTQCEAEGFRRITWFPDRPDVMSVFTTTVSASRERYPVLLSNGNPVDAASLPDGRHRVTWHDPYPKPTYLFALVAGDLACVEDQFTTMSGREVSLRIYVEHHNADRCDHAMASLKKAMRWDEQTYGLEYDLDMYLIVAVDDFNMGAMENKGLNVFNSKYVLARPDTATDTDFANIEGVIAHEYFHNWTGNRVTCRDWFQLSLKEGLTVYRDQEFSADTGSRAVKRIQDVRILRTHQFAEDAGPMAHPVRPDSYIEISNFYTVTVYNKGAEVIRMMHTILGDTGFKDGLRLYFQRHDGQAVTTEEFVRAMEDATGNDLARFRRWYTQAGTPVVRAETHYEPETRRLRLELQQSCPPTPEQPEKLPFHVPLAIALLDDDGCAIEARAHGVRDGVLHLTEAHQEVVFEDVPSPPVLSIGRGFSAPVRIEIERDEAGLAFLMGRDDDPFSRWDAAQSFALRIMLDLVARHRAGAPLAIAPAFVDAVEHTLYERDTDRALIAEALTLPSEGYVADQMACVDPQAIHEVRRFIRRALAEALTASFEEVMAENRANTPYRFTPGEAGRRALRNLCLGYLMERDDPQLRAACAAQLENADNMTDQLAALHLLVNSSCAQRDEAVALFARRWGDDPLVMDKWFTAQATAHTPDTLERVCALLAHARFDMRNPNRVRALIGAFCHNNPVHFHAADGSGYRFAADQVVAIDPANPQVAARLLGAFSRWRRFDAPRQTLMRAELERVLAARGLSKDCYEVASKTLA